MESIRLSSKVSNQRQMRFLGMHRNVISPTILTKILKGLIKDAGRKVFLIVDNLKSPS